MLHFSLYGVSVIFSILRVYEITRLKDSKIKNSTPSRGFDSQRSDFNYT